MESCRGRSDANYRDLGMVVSSLLFQMGENDTTVLLDEGGFDDRALRFFLWTSLRRQAELSSLKLFPKLVCEGRI